MLLNHIVLVAWNMRSKTSILFLKNRVFSDFWKWKNISTFNSWYKWWTSKGDEKNVLRLTAKEELLLNSVF